MKKIFQKVLFVVAVLKSKTSNKIRESCLLTDKNRRLAHQNCNLNVTQKQSIFIPNIFHNFNDYDYHFFLKNLVDMKKVEVKFDIILKTRAEYIYQ